MEKEKKYGYEDLLEIIKTLRSENGCPWDREQTHQSLKPCMTEEAAEVLAAIRIYDTTGEDDNLIEELGDVLLQVVMHSRIAEEEGRFSMEQVIQAVSEKMVRRHPHVFGGEKVETAGEVLKNWEEIKKQEKRTKLPLREIPAELPSLARAPKILRKADKLYKEQPSYEESAKMLEESAERLSQLTPREYDKEIEKQIGDILISLSNIMRICKLSGEQILTDRIEDIIDLYE